MERVFPEVPIRQYVLSPPSELVGLLAAREDVLAAMARVFGLGSPTTTTDVLKLSDALLQTDDKLRSSEADRQGPVNNAVFSSFLETAGVIARLTRGPADYQMTCT